MRASPVRPSACRPDPGWLIPALAVLLVLAGPATRVEAAPRRIPPDSRGRGLAQGASEAPSPADETGPEPHEDAPASLARAFDWTVGVWKGVRRDGGRGDGEPMTMIVEPILGGDGQIRRIEVGAGDRIYQGFAVQVPDAERGIWVRRYVNRGRGWFSSLEGRIEGGESIWTSVTPGRSRESRLVSRLTGKDGWARTMSVSEDGGRSWRTLWTDELHREGGAAD